MRAKDVMSTNVTTIAPDATVREAARKLLERGVSALPVVKPDGALVGIVSEGDLMRRAELGTEPRPRSWWLHFVADDALLAEEFVRGHAVRIADVMTHPVITVTEDQPLGGIAELLEEKHIKRVPVLRDAKLVGIVSRADLIRALAANPPRFTEKAAATDAAIRNTFLKSIEGEGWYRPEQINVIVSDGTIHLWGWTDDKAAAKALRVAAESVPGVRAVKSHLGTVVPWLWAY